MLKPEQGLLLIFNIFGLFLQPHDLFYKVVCKGLTWQKEIGYLCMIIMYIFIAALCCLFLGTHNSHEPTRNIKLVTFGFQRDLFKIGFNIFWQGMFISKPNSRIAQHKLNIKAQVEKNIFAT
jgi:hypothetical protein